MNFDNARADEIFSAAVYLALTAGAHAEVAGGKVYRFENGPWLISFAVLQGTTSRGAATEGADRQLRPAGLSPLPDWWRGLRQEVRVAYEKRTVFPSRSPAMAVARCNRYAATATRKTRRAGCIVRAGASHDISRRC
jgi:hypothetical protein